MLKMSRRLSPVTCVAYDKALRQPAILVGAAVTVMALMAAVFYRILDIIGHFVARVGDEIPALLCITPVHKIDGEPSGQGGGYSS